MGFTLAEVLITIGIIGVVAAITIPNLIQNTNNKELVSQTLKASNILSNGFKSADALDDITKLEENEFKLSLISHLKTTERCGDGYDVCLVDGSRFKWGTYTSDCMLDKTGEGLSDSLKNVCMDITLDVNGKRGPNKEGKDIYRFYLTKSGVIADGQTSSCAGIDCGTYVIANHKLWDGEASSVPVGQAPKVENCSNISEEICTKCNSGYYVSSGTCVPAAGKLTLTVNGETKDYYLSDLTPPMNSGNCDEFLDSYNMMGQQQRNFYQCAKNLCTSKGMRLPNVDEITEMVNYNGTNGIPEYESSINVYLDTLDDQQYINFYFFGRTSGPGRQPGLKSNGSRNSQYSVLCVGN